MSHPAVVLAIGGLDPTGHAGLAADLRAGSAIQTLVAPVASALTVQDRGGVRRVQAVDPELLSEQLAAVLADLPVGAVKIGLLPGEAQARAVAAALAGFTGPVVLDPVLGASPGGSLVEAGLARKLPGLLAGPGRLLTPNLDEAGALLGRDAPHDLEGMRAAGRDLQALGFGAVLVKGGHLQGGRVPDLLMDVGEGLCIEGARVETPNDRGTGCSLATLVAGLLAAGQPLRLACVGAKNALVILLRKGRGHRWPQGRGPIL